jgi:hypothetical protein
MYVYPVFLPPFSNREDLLLIVSLFDDDTGSPINLSGTVLANSANSFTASAWTVTGGAIVTTSTTSLTIPAYPVGSQLSALALTVGTGLGILPGDPILIADTATRKNTMAGYVTSYAASTGALVCQIGMTWQFEIRRQRPAGRLNDDYSYFYDWGSPMIDTPIITAGLGSGLTVIDQGFLQILLPESTMRQLTEKTYLASLTMTDSVNTRQIFVGKLPMAYGGVTN